MLCPTCQRVSPAEDPAEYTAQRAALVVAHGLCLCQNSAPSARTASVDTAAVPASVDSAAAPAKNASTAGPQHPPAPDTDAVTVEPAPEALTAPADDAAEQPRPPAPAKTPG